METLGIDIGGVIIVQVNDSADTSLFSKNYLDTVPVTDSFETIRVLVEQKFSDRVWLISKCDTRIKMRTLAWLEHHKFWSQTGVSPDHVRFCKQRLDKVRICRKLGITHYIDDRAEILVAMRGAVKNRLLFNPRPRELRKFKSRLRGEKIVNCWQDVRV